MGLSRLYFEAWLGYFVFLNIIPLKTSLTMIFINDQHFLVGIAILRQNKSILYSFAVFILHIKVLENELRSLNVQGYSWTVTNDKKFYQVYKVVV